jgi:hypothetical protein
VGDVVFSSEPPPAPISDAEIRQQKYLMQVIRRQRKEAEIDLHRLHLNCLAASVACRNRVLGSELVRAVALSTVPPSWVGAGPSCDDVVIDGVSSGNDGPTLSALLAWFRASYVLETQASGSDNNDTTTSHTTPAAAAGAAASALRVNRGKQRAAVHRGRGAAPPQRVATPTTEGTPIVIASSDESDEDEGQGAGSAASASASAGAAPSAKRGHRRGQPTHTRAIAQHDHEYADDADDDVGGGNDDDQEEEGEEDGHDPESRLVRAVQQLSATAPVIAELFVVFCRVLRFDARLVRSAVL